MTTVAQYSDLITQQHRDKPRFMATLEAIATPLVHIQSVIMSFITAFDVDDAIGRQLDIIGQWVGVSRVISTPISGVYFTWDGSEDDGWDNGVWKSPNDPDSGFSTLPDDLYRRVISAKIRANASCGCISDVYRILAELIPAAGVVKVLDNQDMSMTLQMDVSEITAVERAILETGLLQIQPACVNVVYEEV